MAYTSPQIEGRRQPANSWACAKCGYTDNPSHFANCSYCSSNRLEPSAPLSSTPGSSMSSQPHMHQQPAYNPDYASYSQPVPNVNVVVRINPQRQRESHSHSVPSQQRSQHDSREPFLDEQYEPGSAGPDLAEDNEARKPVTCCVSAIRLILWYTICGGLVTSIWWTICGTIYCFWYSACFKMTRYLCCAFWNKNRRIRIRTTCECYNSHGVNEKNCGCDLCFVILWMLLFGLPCAALHLAFGIVSLPFLLCGFRFSYIHFRILKICLFNPHGMHLAGK